MILNGLSVLLIAAVVTALYLWREAERDLQRQRYANRVLRRQQVARDNTIQALCAANREMTAQRDETQDTLNMLVDERRHSSRTTSFTNVVALPVKAGK